MARCYKVEVTWWNKDRGEIKITVTTNKRKARTIWMRLEKSENTCQICHARGSCGFRYSGERVIIVQGVDLARFCTYLEECQGYKKFIKDTGI